MGRNKIDKEIKKTAISICLDKNIFDGLEILNPKSKSQLINELLRKHFENELNKRDFIESEKKGK